MSKKLPKDLNALGESLELVLNFRRVENYHREAYTLRFGIRQLGRPLSRKLRAYVPLTPPHALRLSSRDLLMVIPTQVQDSMND
jgi:hypothetical protein